MDEKKEEKPELEQKVDVMSVAKEFAQAFDHSIVQFREIESWTRESEDDSWEIQPCTDSLEDQVNEWLMPSESMIINTSTAKAVVEDSKLKRTIYKTLVVVFQPREAFIEKEMYFRTIGYRMRIIHDRKTKGQQTEKKQAISKKPRRERPRKERAKK